MLFDPTELDDTNPEPFGPPIDEITKPRCYICGREQSDSFENGKSWTIRALRKWLATRMSASEAIAVSAAFVRSIGYERT